MNEQVAARDDVEGSDARFGRAARGPVAAEKGGMASTTEPTGCSQCERQCGCEDAHGRDHALAPKPSALPAASLQPRRIDPRRSTLLASLHEHPVAGLPDGAGVVERRP